VLDLESRLGLRLGFVSLIRVRLRVTVRVTVRVSIFNSDTAKVG
jgi:hypothetical protein